MANITTAGPVIDASKLFINNGSVEVEERFFQQFSVNDDGSVAVPVGANGVLGTTRSAGGFSISLTQMPSRDSSARVDYEQLRNDDTIFEIQYTEGFKAGSQFVPVIGYVYGECRVSNVNKTHNADGGISYEIAIMSTSEEKTVY